MEVSWLTPRRSWLFVAPSGIVATKVAYMFGSPDSGALASVAVGCMVSLMFATGYAVSNERVRQTPIDLFSLLL